jgi:hypothetical protein
MTHHGLGIVGDDAFGQHLLNPAQRLPPAFFVLDEGEADVVVAVMRKTTADPSLRWG